MIQKEITCPVCNGYGKVFEKYDPCQDTGKILEEAAPLTTHMNTKELYEQYIDGLIRMGDQNVDTVDTYIGRTGIPQYKEDNFGDFLDRANGTESNTENTSYIFISNPMYRYKTLQDAKDAVQKSQIIDGTIYKAVCSFKTETKTEITYKNLY